MERIIPLPVTETRPITRMILLKDGLSAPVDESRVSGQITHVPGDQVRKCILLDCYGPACLTEETNVTEPDEFEKVSSQTILLFCYPRRAEGVEKAG